MNPQEKIGDYIIEEPISVGKTGQADIYLARRSDGVGQTVAIKVLAEHLRFDEKSIRNFEEEAEILTKLKHNRIVRLEAFDTSPPTPYIVQEFIEGSSVSEALKQSDKPLSLDTILHIGLQVAEALSYAHGIEYFRITNTKKGGKSSNKYKGIVHRDLSTDNILITETGDAKLIDFGVAKAVGVRTITTTTGMGKEFYVAPEVEIESQSTFSTSVDIYSFGVCLYEMVMTGRPERHRINVLKQFHRNYNHLYTAFPEEVPEGLRKIIVRCVQREPKERPQSMREVEQALLEVQEEVSSLRGHTDELPEGLSVQSQLLSFDRCLGLKLDDINDPYLRITMNEEETRILVLCGRRTKVYSFNISGGERKAHHVPHGKHLTALVGLRGEQALGVLADGEGFLLLDDMGEWHTRGCQLDTKEAGILPDNLIRMGKSVYVGDYGKNVLYRSLIDSGQIVGATRGGQINKLGPFTTNGKNLLCIDMMSKSLLEIDLELENFKVVARVEDCDWPVSLATRENALFIVDVQKRRISILDENGNVLEDNALTWDQDLNISQVMCSGRTSKLIVLENSKPALLLFNVTEFKLEILRLVNFVRGFGIEVEKPTYQAIESAVLCFIKKNPEKHKSAVKLIDTLKKTPAIGRDRTKLLAAVYLLLPEIVPQKEHTAALREVAQMVDELGEKERAKQLYLEYLNQPRVIGYDPEIRDKYGRILEGEENWEEIKNWEGEFLSSHYFHDKPDCRLNYERSYERLRKAYAKLGIPLPKDIKVPPTSELIKANSLLDSAKYEEARSKFAELIENEDYKQMKARDAIAVLAGHAKSIKLCLKSLTVEDWQDIYRSLYILIRDYSSEEGFGPLYSLDLKAAQIQIEKRGGSLPEV